MCQPITICLKDLCVVLQNPIPSAVSHFKIIDNFHMFGKRLMHDGRPTERPHTVQITFIFIDFRVCDFAFACFIFRQISICVLNANETCV